MFQKSCMLDLDSVGELFFRTKLQSKLARSSRPGRTHLGFKENGQKTNLHALAAAAVSGRKIS